MPGTSFFKKQPRTSLIPKQSSQPFVESMASHDAFFKIRPTKRSNPEARTTLDSLHRVRIQNIQERENELDRISTEILEIKKRLREMTDEIEYESLEKKIRGLEKELFTRKGGNEMYDYFLNTAKF